MSSPILDFYLIIKFIYEFIITREETSLKHKVFLVEHFASDLNISILWSQTYYKSYIVNFVLVGSNTKLYQMIDRLEDRNWNRWCLNFLSYSFILCLNYFLEDFKSFWKTETKKHKEFIVLDHLNDKTHITKSCTRLMCFFCFNSAQLFQSLYIKNINFIT
jgi:hypothetical protein